MARLTLLLTLLALALPAAALARPAEEAALATERYYSSYGTDPAPIVTARRRSRRRPGTTARRGWGRPASAPASPCSPAVLGAYAARARAARSVGA